MLPAVLKYTGGVDGEPFVPRLSQRKMRWSSAGPWDSSKHHQIDVKATKILLTSSYGRINIHVPDKWLLHTNPTYASLKDGKY